MDCVFSLEGSGRSPTRWLAEQASETLLPMTHDPRCRAWRPLALLCCAAWLPASPAHAQDEFARCLDGLQVLARREGVTQATFESLTRDLKPEPALLELLDNQPEFRTPIWDYLAALVDDERVAEGLAMLARWAPQLAEVERRYAVDPATVVAVWGVESNYGRNFGRRPIVASLATLSCLGRRQTYFRGELIAAMKIVQRGDVRAQDMVGSWAGAFGQTQFMPSTYLRLAVDFDGDGRRDLVGSIPDALASTANFLAQAGWRRGQPWGEEVKLPPGFDSSETGRRTRRDLSHWQSRGVRQIDGSALRGPAQGAALLLPAGVAGPAFIVYRNFDAIYGYNAAESYALAIAHLADRLRGGSAFVTPWPTDDPGLSRAERRELQTLLLARGHAIGEVDGILGAASREAIRAEQQRLGLEVNARAGQKLLARLRADR
jgi:lytic murein transglycosylase